MQKPQMFEFVEHVLALNMGEIFAAGRKATFNQSINQSIFVDFFYGKQSRRLCIGNTMLLFAN